jgi:zinc protease
MGRFGKTVREELGLAYYCFAYAPESWGNALWLASAGVNPENVDRAVETMVQQMRLMQAELVTEEEHEELVKYQLGSMAMMLETKGSIAGRLLMIEQWGLGADYFEQYPEIVRSISREDIREAAQRYFRPEKHVRVIAGPDSG